MFGIRIDQSKLPSLPSLKKSRKAKPPRKLAGLASWRSPPPLSIKPFPVPRLHWSRFAWGGYWWLNSQTEWQKWLQLSLNLAVGDQQVDVAEENPRSLPPSRLGSLRCLSYQPDRGSSLDIELTTASQWQELPTTGLELFSNHRRYPRQPMTLARHGRPREPQYIRLIFPARYFPSESAYRHIRWWAVGLCFDVRDCAQHEKHDGKRDGKTKSWLSKYEYLYGQFSSNHSQLSLSLKSDSAVILGFPFPTCPF